MPNRLPGFANQRIRLLTGLHWLLGVLFSFGLLLAGVAYQTAVAQEIDSLRKGVVKIIANQNGIQTTGTGFIIKQDAKATYIVTAAHVVSGDKFPQVAFFSERHSLIEAEVLQNDLRYDISLLKVRDPSQVPADVVTLMFSVKDNVKDSDALITIGFPPGIEWARIPVTLASRQGADLILDGNLGEGNSGGPVLKNGRIVGLITQSDNQFGRAIPEKFITTVLAGWGITLTQRGVVNVQKPVESPSRRESTASIPTPAKPATAARLPSEPDMVAIESPPRRENAVSTPTIAKPAMAARLPSEPDMVAIPAGKFLMGSPETESDRWPREGPQRTVTIGYTFEISQTEITFAQYDAFANETGRKLPYDGGWGRGNQPVINVSFDDAQAYVAWLSQKTGKRYRLPTEAEWEYVARAGSVTAYWWGDSIEENNAVCAGCGSQWDRKQTAPVGSFKPNAFRVYDTAGNVWEWTLNCWHNNYQHAPVDGAAWLETYDGDCTRRVVRGGSWNDDPRFLRSANRYGYLTDEAYDILGFRVARDF